MGCASIDSFTRRYPSVHSSSPQMLWHATNGISSSVLLLTVSLSVITLFGRSVLLNCWISGIPETFCVQEETYRVVSAQLRPGFEREGSRSMFSREEDLFLNDTDDEDELEPKLINGFGDC